MHILNEGYDGGIDTLEYEGSSLYYANAFEEVVFHQHAWNVTCRQESQCSNESLPRNRIFCSHSESAPSVIVIWNQCHQQVSDFFDHIAQRDILKTTLNRYILIPHYGASSVMFVLEST